MKRLFFTLTCALVPAMSYAEPHAPNPRSLRLNEEAVAHVKAGRFQEAEDAFRAALTADAGNLTAAFNLAGVYLQNKKEELAVKLLERYVATNQGDASLHARLGDAYFVSKDLKSAATHYESAHRIDPKYPMVAARLGTIYSLGSQLTKAEAMFRKAVELDPQNAQHLGNLASLLFANGKHEEAASIAKRSIQAAPQHQAYVTLGSAYEALGKRQEALQAYKEAQKLGDSSGELKEKVETLDRSLRG
jgi:tetratricopeptide (TPR) repeat protein